MYKDEFGRERILTSAGIEMQNSTDSIFSQQFYHNTDIWIGENIYLYMSARVIFLDSTNLIYTYIKKETGNTSCFQCMNIIDFRYWVTEDIVSCTN